MYLNPHGGGPLCDLNLRIGECCTVLAHQRDTLGRGPPLAGAQRLVLVCASAANRELAGAAAGVP
jgi:hypothetical protein